MYEIWLVMNILWEIALGIWPLLLLLAAAAWLLLVLLAWRQPGARWRQARPLAAGLGLGGALLGALLVPASIGSSLHELSYWVDWANLASIALGLGLAVMAFAWPACVLWRRQRALG